MRDVFRALLISLLLIVCFAGSSFGAGFALYEYSARGNALGGTLVGRADDPSALSYNPAGITQLEGDQLMFGLTAIRPGMDLSFESAGIWSNEDNIWIPPHFYYTRQLSDRYWFGISATSRFGLGSEFDEDWPGRYNNYYASIQSFSVTPTLAVKVNDQLSIAAGIEAMWFEFEQKRKLPSGSLGFDTGLGQLDASLLGDDTGWGWNFALHFKPVERVKLGLSYRSQIDQKIEGDVDFSSDSLGSLISVSASGEVTLPDMYMFGIAYDLTERTSVEMDAVYTRWSSYDSLTIRYGEPFNASSTTEKNWNDVWRYQLGVEHALTDHSWLRLGYVYDNTPVPDDTIDYIVPANDRQIYSIGYGFRTKNWTYDLSYSYLDIKERHLDGRFDEGVFDSDISNSDTHLFGISVSYSF